MFSLQTWLKERLIKDIRWFHAQKCWSCLDTIVLLLTRPLAHIHNVKVMKCKYVCTTCSNLIQFADTTFILASWLF